jgi:hypothetical protein
MARFIPISPTPPRGRKTSSACSEFAIYTPKN